MATLITATIVHHEKFDQGETPGKVSGLNNDFNFPPIINYMLMSPLTTHIKLKGREERRGGGEEEGRGRRGGYEEERI